MSAPSDSQVFYEGCGREGPIRCIFLSEFHPVAGPKITCQVPDGYVTKDVFDAVNVYIIPKSPLQRCILTVNTLGHKIVGFPVRIDDQRYARNAYYFNLCFVCDSWARTVQYEPVVKKLAEYLILMEDETGFLSHDADPDEPARCTRLRPLLATVLHDLNARHLCTTVVGETTIYLKIMPRLPDPPAVADQLVPLLLCADYATTGGGDGSDGNGNGDGDASVSGSDHERWDLTTQQVLPHIDGFNHIARIAAKSDVERALVKACVQNLVYYGVVQMVPLLKYSNVYMCTRSLQRLTKEPALGAACRQYVALRSGAGAGAGGSDTGGDRAPPSLQKILLMYACMRHGVNLRMLCERTAPRSNGIDERHLVNFGLLHKLIRCINKYPICMVTPIGRQKVYTGQHNIDEICCRTGLQATKIEEDIESDPMLTVVWK